MSLWVLFTKRKGEYLVEHHKKPKRANLLSQSRGRLEGKPSTGNLQHWCVCLGIIPFEGGKEIRERERDSIRTRQP